MLQKEVKKNNIPNLSKNVKNQKQPKRCGANKQSKGIEAKAISEQFPQKTRKLIILS